MTFKRLLAVTALAIPMMTSAGILGDMNSMFMSNTTASGSVKTKDRVGVVGGSFSMRSPVRSFVIVAFDPPRMDAGCGGIDLFGGNFTFLSSSQLIQIFRQVAANAAGLAFKAAIKLINPSLDQLIGEFQALMQTLNNLGKNTCALAHAIVDPVDRKLHDAVDGAGSTGAVSQSIFSDAAAGLKAFNADANSYLQKAGEVNPKLGNSAVKAIVQSGASAILGLTGVPNVDGSSDDSSNPNSLNNKILVSFLGYDIVGIPCDTANEAGASDSSSTPGANNLGRVSCRAPATLKLDDILKGGGTGSIRENKPLTVYKCANPNGSGMPNGGTDPQICTKMQKEDFNYSGVQGWVNNMLFGSAISSTIQPSSIVGKLNSGGTASMTQDQVKFMKQAGLPLIPLLSKTSNEATRIAIAERLGVYLADCITAKFGESLYAAANSVQYANTHELSEDIKKNIDILRVDYMEKQNACYRDSAVLKVAQELTLSATLNGNNK